MLIPVQPPHPDPDHWPNRLRRDARDLLATGVDLQARLAIEFTEEEIIHHVQVLGLAISRLLALPGAPTKFIPIHVAGEPYSRESIPLDEAGLPIPRQPPLVPGKLSSLGMPDHYSSFIRRTAGEVLAAAVDFRVGVVGQLVKPGADPDVAAMLIEGGIYRYVRPMKEIISRLLGLPNAPSADPIIPIEDCEAADDSDECRPGDLALARRSSQSHLAA